MSTFWAMSIAHSFMSILIHRAGFMSIARYEFYDNIGSMYELCSYYDSGFIMNELCSYISYMTFIMIPTIWPKFLKLLLTSACVSKNLEHYLRNELSARRQA